MAWCENIWAGLGFEAASEMGVGISRQIGLMLSIADVAAGQPVRWLTFWLNSSSIGLGLGGAVGANFIIGLNATRPKDFEYNDAASDSDGLPSLDFSLDMGQGGIGKFAGLGKYFYSAPEMIEMIAISRKFDGNIMSVADALKSYEKNRLYMQTVTENIVKNRAGLLDAHSKRPTMLSFPLPGSLGLRASIKMKFETTDILPQGTL